jgi:hypothetical protein
MNEYTALGQEHEEDGQYAELEKQRQLHKRCLHRATSITAPWVWLAHTVLLAFSLSILLLGIRKTQQVPGSCLEITSAWCKFESIQLR